MEQTGQKALEAENDGGGSEFWTSVQRSVGWAEVQVC